MVYCENGTISLYEGDTGILPVYIKGEIEAIDELEFRIKEEINDEKCIYTDRTSILEGVYNINITREVTSLLTVEDTKKTYYYGFKLYRGDEEIDTIVPSGKIIVRKGV